MNKVNSALASSLERIMEDSHSDFAGLGLIDKAARKLRWHTASGSISGRTLLVEQKLAAGLSGMAIRSGRPARSGPVTTDADVFKLGETVMLGERLRSAATLPLEWNGGIHGVLLLGRRTDNAYSPEQIDSAWQAAKLISGAESTALTSG